jgi:hypothetical protein
VPWQFPSHRNAYVAAHQGAPQHLAHAGQPEELPANCPPQAKILRKNRYVFNFFIQTLILI